jgi:WhiB family redox-sensing transcriptional regulator
MSFTEPNRYSSEAAATGPDRDDIAVGNREFPVKVALGRRAGLAPSRPDRDRPADRADHQFGVEEAHGMIDVPLVDEGILGWQERALCAQTDPEAFFPEKGGSTREAKKVCLSCDVRSQCLEYALAHDERFGIWGGLSERERRRLKKRAV